MVDTETLVKRARELAEGRIGEDGSRRWRRKDIPRMVSLLVQMADRLDSLGRTRDDSEFQEIREGIVDILAETFGTPRIESDPARVEYRIDLARLTKATARIMDRIIIPLMDERDKTDV